MIDLSRFCGNQYLEVVQIGPWSIATDRRMLVALRQRTGRLSSFNELNCRAHLQDPPGTARRVSLQRLRNAAGPATEPERKKCRHCQNGIIITEAAQGQTVSILGQPYDSNRIARVLTMFPAQGWVRMWLRRATAPDGRHGYRLHIADAARRAVVMSLDGTLTGQIRKVKL
jgi:hypothetical protein